MIIPCININVLLDCEISRVPVNNRQCLYGWCGNQVWGLTDAVLVLSA